MEWLKKLIEKHTKDGVINTEELIKEVNTEFPKQAVPKETYNTLSETKKKLEKDLEDRDQQLESLKKINAEDLQKQIETLQVENKTAKEKYEKELKDLQLTNAIKLSVAGKVHDEDLVAGLFDRSKLILGDDGSITGLDEQLKTIQETKAFLFKEEGPDGTGGSLGNGGKGKQDPPVDSLGSALAQYYNK